MRVQVDGVWQEVRGQAVAAASSRLCLAPPSCPASSALHFTRAKAALAFDRNLHLLDPCR